MIDLRYFRLPAGSQNSGNCTSTGATSLRRIGGRVDGGRDPNFRALTAASTVMAGGTSDVSGASSTTGAGSGAMSAGMKTLLFSA